MLNKTVQHLSILCALSLSLSLHPMAYANETGMTWKKVSHNETLGVDRVYCINCDAYQGDTNCKTKLPILCLKKDSSPDPGIPIPSTSDGVMPPDFYHGWAEGHIGLTFPVAGYELAGVEDANDICEVQFGPGYRIGEHHDGKVQSGGYGGWGWYAYGNIDDSSRFWVNINGQSANCWGNSPGGHTGRTEAEILTLLLGSDNPSPSVCTEAELDAAYDNGYTTGYDKGVEFCGIGNYPSPTYRFDSRKKTGILTLPTVDIQLMNPLFPNKWSTLYDAYSVVMELMPGTSGYFYITKAEEKQPTAVKQATTDAKEKQPTTVKQPAPNATSTQQAAQVK